MHSSLQKLTVNAFQLTTSMLSTSLLVDNCALNARDHRSVQIMVPLAQPFEGSLKYVLTIIPIKYSLVCTPQSLLKYRAVIYYRGVFLDDHDLEFPIKFEYHDSSIGGRRVRENL
ncbi:hypothetical protein Plhal304r1_c039g0116901 [Plasmopara halstedii]